MIARKEENCNLHLQFQSWKAESLRQYIAEILQKLWRLLIRKLMNILKGGCQVLPVHTELSMIYKKTEAQESPRTLQNCNKNLHAWRRAIKMACVADTQIYLQILKTTRSKWETVINSLQQRWDKIKRLTTVIPWLVPTRHIQNEHIPKQNSRSVGRGLKTNATSSSFSLNGSPT